MSTIINARSPYFIKVSPSSGTLSSASMALFIYAGTFTTDKPGSATYTISKNIIGTNDFVVFEISELIRDYLVTEYGSTSDDGVWVEADITLTKTSGSETSNLDFLAFDGYAYFEDGVNPRTNVNPAVTKVTGTTTGDTDFKLVTSGKTFTKTVRVGDTVENTSTSQSTTITSIDSDNQLGVALDIFGNSQNFSVPDTNNFTPQYLQSNTTIYFKAGRDIVFPVFAEAEGTISFTTPRSSVKWNEANEFWNLATGGWNTAFSDLTVSDTSISTDKIVYIRITPTDTLVSGDTITVSTSKSGYAQSQTITLEEICEPRYTYINLVFYNKFGALQQMPFNKKSIESLTTTSKTYQKNIIDLSSTPRYNTEKHQTRQFQMQGQEKITVNTGYIDESFNEVIRQLLLSEQVYLDDGTTVRPVVLDTNSLTFKTSVNDRLTNYTINLSFASNKINDIR
jgi:hypothetical protein